MFSATVWSSATPSIRETIREGILLHRRHVNPLTDPAARLQAESGAVIVAMHAMRERWARHCSALFKGCASGAAALSTVQAAAGGCEADVSRAGRDAAGESSITTAERSRCPRMPLAAPLPEGGPLSLS